MHGLTLRRKIAQLVVIPVSGQVESRRSREYQEFTRLVRKECVGGLVLVNVAAGRVIRRAEPYALAAFLNRAQRLAPIPLIVAGDFERGASMRVADTTPFPHAMAFGATQDPETTRYAGKITAQEARALGVHWLFFPVADVNNNPDNPIINIRSFGEDPALVSAHVRAFIAGVQEESRRAPVLTTAKHFPGHGDTATDTHLNLAVIPGDRARLEEVEFTPFRAAIAQGVDSIMTAHIAVPALDPGGDPATLSRPILTGVLRKEMGFDGLIVTDALDMGGIVKQFGAGEAAVRALEAGADVLLMPPDPVAAIDAVSLAVRKGRLPVKRIDESVAKILRAKERLGLDHHRLVNLETLGDVLDSPEAGRKAQEIAERAVTQVKNEAAAVPLRAEDHPCFFILTENRRSAQGEAAAKEIRQRLPSAPLTTLDPSVPEVEIEAAAGIASGCGKVVVAAFASVAAYRGDNALAGSFPKLMERLLGAGKPLLFVALGNPYLIRHFPGVAAYLATFSTVPPSEIAAVKVLFGEIPARGRLPITIPGIAARAAGPE